MSICPQCGTQFKPKSSSHKFCKKTCYSSYWRKRIEERYKERMRVKRENPIYPKYIDENGNVHQLTFDPSKSPLKFQRFKENLKTTD